jgi:signal transduction histidine kinase
VDHGVGLTREQQCGLFEPFRHIDGTYRPSGPRGVSLSVAKRIVAAHGGRLDVSSKLGEGATFHVHLPLAPPPAMEEAAAPIAPVTTPGAAQPTAPGHQQETR